MTKESGKMMGDPNYDLPKRPGKIIWILKQPGVWRKLEYVFYRTLCPYPDQTKIGMWWYGVSGMIAGYFHRKTCARCKERHVFGWWAKYGHWDHVSFWRAMDHLFRGGKIRFGRW